MKIISKAALLAISALSMAASPVYAGTITSPAYLTPVTATGPVDIHLLSIAGTALSCPITLLGYVEKVGSVDKITFTSQTTFCGIVLGFPFSLDATSSSQVTADRIYLDHPTTPCGSVPNIVFAWSGSTATRSTTFSAGPCNVTFFDLNISPTVTII